MAQAFYVEGLPARTYAEWEGTQASFDAIKVFDPDLTWIEGVFKVGTQQQVVNVGEYVVEAEGGGICVKDQSTFEGQYRAY